MTNHSKEYKENNNVKNIQFKVKEEALLIQKPFLAGLSLIAQQIPLVLGLSVIYLVVNTIEDANAATSMKIQEVIRDGYAEINNNFKY